MSNLSKKFGYHNKNLYYEALTKTHNYIKQCYRREYIRTSDELAAVACRSALVSVLHGVKRLITNDEMIVIERTRLGGEYMREQIFYFLFISRTLRNAGLFCDHDLDTIQWLLKKLPIRHPKMPSRMFHLLKSSVSRWPV
uniref:Uncharacterized protein n=1 Tax=Leptospira mayottensis 200901116 TaxID=1192864 RepID=A0A343US46_9LEPT|nr:hypothetical protein [Leptospira mayottensis]AVH81619.1 hypothetical protein [Leptospira mayottensis 200901116]